MTKIISLIFMLSLAYGEDPPVPITVVERPAVDEESYVQVLGERIKGKKNKQEPGCEAEAARVKIVFDKLIQKSQLTTFANGSFGIFPVVLCKEETLLKTGSGADGRIVISRWITKKVTNESQLAFAIAHEIGHFTLAHDEIHIHGGAANNIKDEKAADLQGLKIMSNAGYDVGEAIKFQEMLIKVAGQANAKICLTQCDPELLKGFKAGTSARLQSIKQTIEGFSGDEPLKASNLVEPARTGR